MNNESWQIKAPWQGTKFRRISTVGALLSIMRYFSYKRRHYSQLLLIAASSFLLPQGHAKHQLRIASAFQRIQSLMPWLTFVAVHIFFGGHSWTDPLILLDLTLASYKFKKIGRRISKVSPLLGYKLSWLMHKKPIDLLLLKWSVLFDLDDEQRPLEQSLAGPDLLELSKISISANQNVICGTSLVWIHAKQQGELFYQKNRCLTINCKSYTYDRSREEKDQTQRFLQWTKTSEQLFDHRVTVKKGPKWASYSTTVPSKDQTKAHCFLEAPSGTQRVSIARIRISLLHLNYNKAMWLSINQHSSLKSPLHLWIYSRETLLCSRHLQWSPCHLLWTEMSIFFFTNSLYRCISTGLTIMNHLTMTMCIRNLYRCIALENLVAIS